MSCQPQHPRAGLVSLAAAGLLLAFNVMGADTASSPIPLLMAPAALADQNAPLPDRVSEALAAAQRFRMVQINPQALTPDSLTKGSSLYLGLFDDVHLWAVIDRVATDINGVRSVRGRIQDSEHGTVLLSIKDGRILATISLPERQQEYIISDFGQKVGHVVQDVDPDLKDVLESGPDLLPPDLPAQKKALQNRPDASADTPATIDLMIVYTPAARQWANSSATSIQHVIDQTMQRNQLALDNSQLGITMNLVHTAEINYTESGDSGTDLYRLTFHAEYDPWGMEGTPRYMEEVHAWRDTYGADVVSLLARVEDTGGLGWQLNTEQGWQQLAFNLNRVQQAHNTYTVIHEIGHNMGAHHHKAQNFQPGPGLYSYSGGWRWTGQDSARYCSIMTYESGSYFSDGRDHVRVPYFSSPNISYQGVATGQATDGDNARTLMNTKATVAAYRVSSATPPPAVPSDLTATAASATAINLSWTDNSDNETGFKIERKTGTNGSWSQIATTAANATSHTNTGLTAGQTYLYRVRATNSAGNSAYSNVVTITPQAVKRADFVVTAITLTPANPAPNTLFSATVTVKNQGTAAGDGGWLDVWTHRAAAATCGVEGNQYKTVGTLAVGQVKTLTFSGLRAARAAGAKTFRAYVDSFCRVTELNDGNNQAIRSYQVQ
ncbi:M12 family metallo-peptidase [Thiobaca trueperi]|uniref:CARDB protein n=1 Tax=Thiobaca trueperi TaxID=127458 RepID=A0A4V2V275_9GAMM|nr:M12 family metallo-peptidase [Thiobaca trueperi]TCT24002.1 CARDB protein [Thiobaca trueperi]